MKGNWRYVFLTLLAIGLIVLAREGLRVGQMAVDISAKWACSCYFVDGNSEATCRAQDPVYFADIRLAFQQDSNSVVASWLGFSSVGVSRPGMGCRVE